jgi:hypothetical protein
MGRTCTKSLLVAAFLAALTGLGVAGCGGSSTETSSIVSAPKTGANQPVDKASFVRQANSICAEANGAISGLPSGTSDSSSVAAQEGIVRGEVKSLQSLGTPASGKPQFDRYLAALDDLARELQREKKAIDSGGNTSVAATAVASAQSSAQSAARSFGAHDCAGSASPSGSAVAGGGGGGAASGGVTPTTTVPVTPTTTVPTTAVPTTPTTVAPPPSSGGAAGGGTGGTSGSAGSGGVGVGTP